VTRAGAVAAIVAGAAASGALLAGCIAFPVAAPPLHGHLTFGSAGGELLDRDDQLREQDTASWMRLRLGVNPLQLLERHRGRRLDFGLGYSWQGSLDAAHARPGVHGVYGYLAYHPVHLPLDETWAFRVLVQGAVEAALHDARGGMDVGGGGTLGATAEFTYWADGPVEDDDGETNFIGVAHGEGGLGLTFEAGYHVVGPQAFWSVTAGLVFRFPAIAGLAIYWL
jgi:hypothetical protein